MQVTSRRIAIADDEPAFRRAMARLLRTYGFDSVAFASGHALLRAVPQGRFDCILLDLAMPDFTGFDVLAALRALNNVPPVVVVTGRDEPEAVRRAMELEAFDCHKKPVRAPELVHAIERACAASAS
ncbi:MAG: response regulator [Burkholderiales bacterium]